jgi:CheY-like chemotaxis protein
MWLVSEPGKGSTFGFSLPQPTVAESAPPWQADISDGRPLVVVIEDDPNSAELVALHLDAAGLRALQVRTGEEGLAAVRQLGPSAIVLDIRLPGMDGWEVLAALKASPETADTPVIVMSVLPERGRGFALGASDYLVKPVGKADLLAALQRISISNRPETRRAVVVLDHDPVLLDLIRQTWEPLGWTIDICTEESGAHEVVSSTRPAVVLVDLLTAAFDGFAVIEGLAADPDTATIPVVVLTAKTLTASERQRLNGRIEYVAARGDLDLVRLSSLLARFARPERTDTDAASIPWTVSP